MAESSGTNGSNGDKPGRALSKREQDALAAERRKEIEAKMQKGAPPVPYEPRCDCCNSPHRNFIDAMLIRGANYSKIAEKIPGEDGKIIDRRSVARHAKKHLGYHEDALRSLLEEEANFAHQNYEEGVKGAITHRGVLEITVQKYYDDLISGNITVEARDALAVMQSLQKLNEDTEAVALDEMRSQVNSLIQAIREETDFETGRRIAERAERIYKTKQIGPSIDGTDLP